MFTIADNESPHQLREYKKEYPNARLVIAEFEAQTITVFPNGTDAANWIISRLTNLVEKDGKLYAPYEKTDELRKYNALFDYDSPKGIGKPCTKKDLFDYLVAGHELIYGWADYGCSYTIVRNIPVLEIRHASTNELLFEEFVNGFDDDCLPEVAEDIRDKYYGYTMPEHMITSFPYSDGRILMNVASC